MTHPFDEVFADVMAGNPVVITKDERRAVIVEYSQWLDLKRRAGLDEPPVDKADE